jgi:hypothetical protein
MSFNPATEKCERCGRLVVDASTDFGNGLVLRPTCEGIRVAVNDDRVIYLSERELRDFLERAYG